jgi:membrane protease subunit (stomatin/prohibitin family)
MGLIKALVNDVRGVLADQWLEYFNCDALPENVLLVKGTKYVSKGGQNVKGNDNVISDGARIDIADGQFMMIVENGLIVDFCAEPGQYTYKTDLQPSLLSGGFSALGKTFKEIGKRFTGGGQAMSKQVVYYVNTKEILGNKWGAGAVPFRDSEFNFTMKIGAYGEYSYKITNPLLFYKNV